MFVLGVEGDIVAQYSRGDASLVTSVASNDWLVNPFCNEVTIDCGMYWKSRIGFNFITFLADTNVYIDGRFREGHRTIPWILILGSLFVIVHLTRKYSDGNSDLIDQENEDLFGISFIPQFENYFRSQLPRYATSILLVIFTFTSTAGCFPLLMGAGEGESGTPVWLLGIGSGIPAHTPSVSNESSSGGGSTSSGNARIDGMYFYHPDHLGSITMITDGNGNVLAGGERGGKSHITYKPYGEILRTDSYGPDITKFKYTGQEEDRESGLYYYKARYYDAGLGRFITSDTVTNPSSVSGMNTFMYVEGNPNSYKDRSGNSLEIYFYAALVLTAQNVSKKDDDERQILALTAYFVQRQQVQGTKGGGCPMNGKNPAVFGNFQGSGRCGGKLPKDLILPMVLSLAIGQPEYAVMVYLMLKPNSPLTIVDKSGIDHDERHRWSTSKAATRANEDWIKQSWKNTFSINNQKASYWREYDALPKKYDRLGNTAKSYIAAQNYIATTIFDLGALRLGTDLFAMQNIIAGGVRFVGSATSFHKWKNRIKSGKARL
jgi:RHS repeat-associated protein